MHKKIAKNLAELVAGIGLSSILSFNSYSQNTTKVIQEIRENPFGIDTILYNYDALNRMIEENHAVDTNRDKKTDFVRTINYDYDNAGKIVEVNYKTKNNKGKIIHAEGVEYEYDKSGNLIRAITRKDIDDD